MDQIPAPYSSPSPMRYLRMPRLATPEYLVRREFNVYSPLPDGTRRQCRVGDTRYCTREINSGRLNHLDPGIQGCSATSFRLFKAARVLRQEVRLTQAAPPPVLHRG